MAASLPNGASFDPFTRTITVGRGVANTLLVSFFLLLIAIAEVGAAIGLVKEPEPRAKLGLAAGMLVGGLIFAGMWMLWRARWSIHPEGITIRAGSTRTHAWADITALQVISHVVGSGRPSSELVIRRREGPPASTPTRPTATALRRILSYAVEQGLVPDHVELKL